jgi:hypothetical protein
MHADADTTELAGNLERVDLEGGFWRLRLPPGDDRFGGAVVLGDPADLAGYADGASVRVRGRVDEFGASIAMAGTTFLLDHVEPADG